MRTSFGTGGWCEVALRYSYMCDVLGEALHVLHRHRGVSQLDRPLVVLSCAAVARGHAVTVEIHHPELADGGGMILSRSLLDPWPCLLIVHGDTAAIVVHEADLPLAQSVTLSLIHI